LINFQTQISTRNNETKMIRLNPTTDSDETVLRGVFPPSTSYYRNLLSTETFVTLLATNVLKNDGMTTVAKYYNIEDQWNAYLKEHERDTQATKYYVLLSIVKSNSPSDRLYVSFVEGLHRHAAIILCLTCSCFDLTGNTLQSQSLKQKHFKEVPFFKKTNTDPIDVLNEIMDEKFPAKMLTQTFPVQILYPSNDNCQIQPLFDTLVNSSSWISTNKRGSAEKQISTRLSETLIQIMTLSTSNDRQRYRPKLMKQFKYQTDLDADKFQTKMRTEGNENWVQFPDMLSEKEYLTYIANPFNQETTRDYLETTSPPAPDQQKMKSTKFPPYGIRLENLTKDVGSVQKGGVGFIDVRHYNAYLIIPQIIYHLSSKLMNEPLHNRVGQQREIQMIKFLTRYGYATRANPYLKLHGAYSKYTDIKQGSYINSCDGWNRIVPVTLFLVTLFNASLMYHENCEDNLLTIALNGFDIGESLTDDTFMNSLSKCFFLKQIIPNLNNYLIQ